MVSGYNHLRPFAGLPSDLWFRFWQTGNIGGASWTDIRLLAPYFVMDLSSAFAWQLR